MDQDTVQIIFIRKSQILLGFRQNTKVLSNKWGFPSGRIESGETPNNGAVRESIEEVSVKPIDLVFIGELQDPIKEIKHYFYLCSRWKGDLKNAEPHLCREISWFEIDNLPSDCTPITYTAINSFKDSVCRKV